MKEFCLNYGCEIDSIKECEIDSNMECDLCEHLARCDSNDWEVLGRKTKVIDKLLSQCIEYSNELKVSTTSLIQMKNSLIKFKSKAENKMFSAGIEDTHVFY